MPRKKTDYIISVADCETDPFRADRVPEAFCIGFYDGETYVDFWGDDCVKRFFDFLYSLKRPRRIYFHNGGKFDFFMFLEYLENPVKIINGRIVVARIGIHELRDSYAIIPIPLKAYQKDDTDYSTFEREVREMHKAHILEYLKTDCFYLFDLVSAFNKRFGDMLTVGGTAIKELQKFHPFQRGTKEHDEQFRPFYFGGRVEFWRQGIFTGPFRIFDVNSMYPDVMRRFKHPTGDKYIIKENPTITNKGEIKGFEGAVYFAEIEGVNNGALPTRTKQGLDFQIEQGIFFATGHELRVAITHRLFKPVRCIRAYICMHDITFKTYVDTYHKEKNDAKARQEKAVKLSVEYNAARIDELFAKFLLNSAYGKFGQNPENYYDWLLLPANEYPDIDAEPWELYESHDSIKVWRKPIERHSYFDVATAASITGAARSVLLEAIAKSKGVIYCDTDSIILSGKFGASIDSKKLGAWKEECRGNTIAISGKKMYALFEGDEKSECVKYACKGVSIKPSQIVEMCQGKTIAWECQAPSFKLAGGVAFTKRSVKMNVKKLAQKS